MFLSRKNVLANIYYVKADQGQTFCMKCNGTNINLFTNKTYRNLRREHYIRRKKGKVQLRLYQSDVRKSQ